jgi:hypothetical protein
VDQAGARLRHDGYVYLPGFLDPADVLAVQEGMRQVLFAHGQLADPSELTVRPDAAPPVGHPDWFGTVYPALQRLEPLHRLAHTPALLALMTDVLGEEAFCHAAKVARVAAPTLPGRYTTQAHQDFVKLHVEADVLTAWIALTPCTPRRQGIRILRQSHRDGFLPVDPVLGNSLPVYVPVAFDDPRWLTADFALGDVVVFHSLTVHSGGVNATGTLRLSMDVRYQRRSDPLRSEYAQPHGWPTVPGWPELTAGWSTDRWVRTPHDVPLEPMPPGVSYADYLTTLTAPPSRLLG